MIDFYLDIADQGEEKLPTGVWNSWTRWRNYIFMNRPVLKNRLLVREESSPGLKESKLWKEVFKESTE